MAHSSQKPEINEEEHEAVRSYLTTLAYEKDRYALEKQRQIRAGRWATLVGILTTLVAAVATVFPALALSKINVRELWARTPWASFIVVLVIAQSLLILFMQFKRRTSGRRIKFQTTIADCYLKALDESKFNPYVEVYHDDTPQRTSESN